MKKATIVVSKDFLGNKLFAENDEKLNRDNCLAPFIALKKEFKNNGFDLATQDLNKPVESEIVIYNDMPKTLPSKEETQKSSLLIMESPLVVKSSWDIKKHEHFAKIFTWKDSVIDNKKYFKINYTHAIPESFNWPEKRSKFCTLISAHKLSGLKDELYSERIKCIRWFEKNHPGKFDLYGIGWDKPAFKGLFKAIKKIPFYEKLIPFKKFISYKGPVKSKYETMVNYDFAICYENIKDEDGYITEKIFDCFFAGTIPIYWGAINISDFVPQNTFIDRRKFKSYGDLFSYMSKLSLEEKNQIRSNIKNFLLTSSSNQFRVKAFAETVCAEVLRKI